jgi:regulator of nucleoside diphosphate kinase
MSKAPLAQAAARPRIVVTASEHAHLSSMAERAAERDLPVGEYLVEELSRAQIVPDDQISPTIVRMGSKVTYREDSTGRVRTVTLVFPRDANIDQQRISVLTPIGAALIGLSPGQSIDWPTPDGDLETLTVVDVENATEVATSS